MLNAFFGLTRPILFFLSPEQSHALAVATLESGFHPRQTVADDPSLTTNLWGLTFPNPIAIAAGFDKDARVQDALLGLGCGFAEVGTLTPLAQAGNPNPRVFRLIEDRAIINRLGFNNGGHQAALTRLSSRARNGIVGVNIGANKESADRAGDYVRGLETFYGVASYFTVNISSPNTPGLRDLQAPAALDALLTRLMDARNRLVANGQPSRPLIIKLSPDIAEDDLMPICERLTIHGVDGIAVSNTTLARPRLFAIDARQGGGLSGKPLFHRATVMLARVYQATSGKIPLIGIGGIDSPEAALSKFEAGASLIQLYTGLVYEGPGLIDRIKVRLVAAARKARATSVASLTGTKAAEWASKTVS